jgi:DNA-binding response OmpR family regulator
LVLDDVSQILRVMRASLPIRGYDQTEYLRVFVNQLGRKIEPDLEHPRYILTDPWVGYCFHPHD